MTRLAPNKTAFKDAAAGNLDDLMSLFTTNVINTSNSIREKKKKQNFPHDHTQKVLLFVSIQCRKILSDFPVSMKHKRFFSIISGSP